MAIICETHLSLGVCVTTLHLEIGNASPRKRAALGLALLVYRQTLVVANSQFTRRRHGPVLSGRVDTDLVEPQTSIGHGVKNKAGSIGDERNVLALEGFVGDVPQLESGRRVVVGEAVGAGC
jgi:hypothetical protein